MKRLLSLLLLLPALAFAAAGDYVDRSGTVTLGGTSQTLAAALSNRGPLIITNPSTETEVLCVNLTSAASCTSPGSFLIQSGGSLTLKSDELITVVAATTGHKYTAKEGAIGATLIGGGSGGGGGGGGAVTSTDGALTTLGTTTDVKCVGSSSNCTAIAIFKTLLDPTTQLPTTLGQTTASGSVSFVQASDATPTVAQGSTTSGQKGNLSQGAVTTAAPSYTTGQTSPISLDTAGSLRVAEPDSLALTVTSVTAAAPTATATFTNGSANIGWTAHGLVANQTVYFTTTGALPTNFSAGTVTTNNYYVKTVVDANTFTVSATPGGTVITAGSAGSGTQTGVAPTVMFYQDLTGYESYSYQVTSAGTSCTITYETSDDAQNWIVHPGLGSSLNNNVGSTTSSTTAVGTKFGKWGKWSRARVSTFTSGTVAAVGTAHKAPFTSQLAIGAGSGFSVAGGSGQGVAVSGNPFMMGLEAYTAAPTAVTTGQTTRAMGTVEGKVVNLPFAIPELSWSYAAASGGIVNTSDVSMKAADAALRNYVKSCSIINAHATVATEVVIKDASTVMWRGYVGAGAATALSNTVGGSIDFNPPLRGTVNQAVNAAAITTGAAVYFNCQGYTAP